MHSLRLLFRHLQSFRSLAESEGISEITAPNGAVWSLHDIEYLYARAMRRPAKITGTRIPAPEVTVGHHIQHGGKWRRVMEVGRDSKKSSTIYAQLLISEAESPEDSLKRKKFSETATVLVLSPAEKKKLDYDKANPCLPVRQQQAIELFLVWNMPEEEAALAMGLTKTNPIGMYATSGLGRLLNLMDEGYLPRFRASDTLMLAVV